MTFEVTFQFGVFSTDKGAFESEDAAVVADEVDVAVTVEGWGGGAGDDNEVEPGGEGVVVGVEAAVEVEVEVEIDLASPGALAVEGTWARS